MIIDTRDIKEEIRLGLAVMSECADDVWRLVEVLHPEDRPKHLRLLRTMIIITRQIDQLSAELTR